MRKQDIVLLVGSLCSMALGVCMPFIGEPLSWFPRVCMLWLLFICFLGVDGMDAWRNVTHYPWAILLLICLKLIIMPFICWGIIYLVFPEFSLGVVLLGGSATAVVAPFFAFMVQADVVLVVVGLVTTSLLLPLTLPLVLACIGKLAQVEGGIQLELPVFSMILSLSTMIVVPFICAQILRRKGPNIAETILTFRQYFFFVGSSLTLIVIFAQYSVVILQSPQYLLYAFICAAATGLLVFFLVSSMTFWLPPVKQLAFVISCVAINNVVVLVLSVDFFHAPEALTTAMYSGVLFLTFPFYRVLARLRRLGPR